MIKNNRKVISYQFVGVHDSYETAIVCDLDG